MLRQKVMKIKWQTKKNKEEEVLVKTSKIELDLNLNKELKDLLKKKLHKNRFLNFLNQKFDIMRKKI